METMKKAARRLRGARIKPLWFAMAVVALLLLWTFVDHSLGKESQKLCVRFVSEVQFADVAKGRTAATVDAGKGLTFELSPTNSEAKTPGPEIGKRAVTVLDKARKVHDLPESFYISSSCIEKSPTTYWVVEEYTGGMHCCNRYHFFSKSGADGPIRYLGATDGTMNPLENPWVCKGADLYFEDSDIRFVYFHVDYASSRLHIPRFYHLMPSSISVNNRAFKDVYRDELNELKLEINEKTSPRKSKHHAIISGNKTGHFSDELGQLLVQRTILYLFSREKDKAWGTFQKDVQSNYETTEGVALLRREVEKLLKESPY